MQNPPRHGLMRRILFPYSGEEPLSLPQSLRVIFAWAVLIPLPISLVILAIGALISLPLSKLALLFIFSFLSGVFIFGLLSLVIVVMSNRAARLRQAWRAERAQHNRGGRYGS